MLSCLLLPLEAALDATPPLEVDPPPSPSDASSSSSTAGSPPPPKSLLPSVRPNLTSSYIPGRKMSPRTKGRDSFPPPVFSFVLVSPSAEEEGEEGGAPRSQPLGNELITAVAVEEGRGREGGEEAEDEAKEAEDEAEEAEDEEEDNDDGDQCDDDDDESDDGLPFLPGEVDGGAAAEPVPSATTMRAMASPIPVACSAASPASVWVGAVVASSSGAAARATERRTTARTSVAARRRGCGGIATSSEGHDIDFISSRFLEIGIRDFSTVLLYSCSGTTLSMWKKLKKLGGMVAGKGDKAEHTTITAGAGNNRRDEHVAQGKAAADRQAPSAMRT